MNDEELIIYIEHGHEDEPKEALVLISKDGSRWIEKFLCGDKPYGFEGKKYMSYLKPKDILSWLRKDYYDATLITEEWLENNDFAINYSHLEGFYQVCWSMHGVDVE